MGSARKGDYTKGTKRGVGARFFAYARVPSRHYRPRALTVRAIESPLGSPRLVRSTTDAERRDAAPSGCPREKGRKARPGPRVVIKRQLAGGRKEGFNKRSAGTDGSK